MSNRDKKITINNNKIKYRLLCMVHSMMGSLKYDQTMSLKIQEIIKIVCKISTHWIQLGK